MSQRIFSSVLEATPELYSAVFSSKNVVFSLCWTEATWNNCISFPFKTISLGYLPSYPENLQLPHISKSMLNLLAYSHLVHRPALQTLAHGPDPRFEKSPPVHDILLPRHPAAQSSGTLGNRHNYPEHLCVQISLDSTWCCIVGNSDNQ